MIDKKLEAKLKRIHLFYYWSSGFIEIFEGFFKIVTLGLIKTAWHFWYCSYWANMMCNVRIAHAAKWVDANPNRYPLITDDDSIKSKELWEKVELGNWIRVDDKWLKVIRIKNDFGVCRFYTDNTDGYGIINPLNITAYSRENPNAN